MWMATPDGAINYINDALLRFSGCSPESLLGDQWLSIVHPDDRPPVVAAWEASIATGDPYEVEYRILRADGEYRWHVVRAKPELDDHGKVERWWGSAVDLHEHRLREAQAAQRAADREAILESITDGVYTLDNDFRFTYVNGCAEDLLGYTREALMGNVLWDAIPEVQGSDLGSMLTRVHETGRSERIFDCSGADVTFFDVGASTIPDGLVVHLHDITKVKNLSEQLVAAQRLEALGQLTGGIAHDFNNLLTVVMGATETLSTEPHPSPRSREVIELVNQAALHGSELTHRLLAFASRKPLVPQIVDVSRHAGNLIPLLKRALGESIELASDLALGLPSIQVDPGQLENSLLNLAINARNAMPDGGLLELRTGITELDEEFAASHDDIEPGRYITVSVGDKGTGIAPEHLSRLFDPFFTTKPVGQGSGLGLSMVKGFTTQSGGTVEVYSELGQGTTIRLFLPVVDTDVGQNGEDWSDLTPLTRGTGHVLLAEDDDLVRRFATDQLTAWGYNVTAVGSGPEALRALEAIGPVDLLFTDMVMPGGMTGRQLAMEVLERRPGTPVLFTSGYTEGVLMHDGQLDADSVLLAKPYSGRQVTEAVQQLLSPHPHPPSQ